MSVDVAKPPFTWVSRVTSHIYSYFERGCRKSTRDNSERYCGWFWVHSFSKKKFERMARKVMDVCLRVLKKSNKNMFDRNSSILVIFHITFRDCRVHIFSDNLSWSSCMSRIDKVCSPAKKIGKFFKPVKFRRRGKIRKFAKIAKLAPPPPPPKKKINK